MKTVLFAAAASVVVFAAAPAAAQGLQEAYLQGNLGYSIAGEADVGVTVSDGVDSESISGDLDLDGGFVMTGALGARLTNVRVEGELLYTKNDVDDGGDEELGDLTIDQWSVMANVLYDFDMAGVAPYVGAGVGYGNTSINTSEGDIDDSGLAWQLRAGVTFGEKTKVDIGYRYLRFADFEASAEEDDLTLGLEVEAAVHAITVGARIPLG